MDLFQKKWGLLYKAIVCAVIMIILRYIVDYYGYDVIPVNALLGALVTGVVFTIAMILTGTLSDYKEAERVPSELIAIFKSLWYDSFLTEDKNKDTGYMLRSDLRNLWAQIYNQFKAGTWEMEEVQKRIHLVNARIVALNDNGHPPTYVGRLRAEMVNLDKICHRVYQIKATDFIPAAYAISEIAIACMLVVLVFVKSDTVFDTAGIAILTMLVIGLISLIKDIDDPFEAPGEGFADVDMFQFYEGRSYLQDL